MAMSTPLEGIDRATLTPVVRRVLRSNAAEVIDWRSERLHGGLGGMASSLPCGVYRFTGSAWSDGRACSWTVVLKASQVGDDDPAGVFYWRRELLAYQSGLLAKLPGGLAAPRCFGAAETGTHETWLWLDDVRESYGGKRPLSRYVLAARHLGQLNGAYLAGLPLPDAPWLSSGWLRRYLGTMHASLYEAYAEVRDHPLVRRGLAGGEGDRLVRLWADREVFLKALERLPRAFCHLDAYSRNLFAIRGRDGADETVAVDWAYAGIAAVGEELAPLVWASLGFGDVELSLARELNELAIAGYLDGLRDAGWKGDPRLARFGYLAASILRYSLFPMPIGFATLDGERLSQAERAFGQTAEEYVDGWIERQRISATLVDEALRLLPLVG